MNNHKFIGQMHWHDRYSNKTKEEFKLDLIDKKILYLLRLNARLSDTFIAKQLHLKRETVSYRIKRMEENFFIYGYSTIMDHRKLGLKNYLVFLKLKTLITEKEIIDYLLPLKEVVRLHNCSGSFDLRIIYSTKTEKEFNSLLTELINKYHHVINNYELFTILEEGFLGPTFYIPESEIKKLNGKEHKGSSFQKELNLPSSNLTSYVLDNDDVSILELLKLNARISIKELSKTAGLTTSIVNNRIKKLVANKIITAFYAVPSFSVLGYQWYNIFLQVKNIEEKKLTSYLQYNCNASWHLTVIGKWNYIFTIFAKDNVEFHKILDNIRTEFSENILSYDSIIIFNRYKDAQRIE